MTHVQALATMRAEMRGRDYTGALRTGRAELESGRDSAELLVLMAMAAQLDEADDSTLDEVRFWLERAADSDPRNVDARLELGHFLDSVADRPDLAVDAFEAALVQAVEFVEAAFEGLTSAAETADQDTEERVRVLRSRVRSKLLALPA